MARKKSDLATAADCDWSFLEIPGMIEHLWSISEWAGGRWHVDPNDLFQEAVLFLGVRPELVVSKVIEGGLRYVLADARWDIEDIAREMARKARREEPVGDLTEEEECE